MDWLDLAIDMLNQKNSWDNVIEAMRDYKEFEELSDRQIYEKTRKAIFRKNKKETKIVVAKNKIIGVVGDLHAPFDHDNYFNFITDTFEKNRIDEVVFIGDLADHHAISRHLTEPNACSAYDELERTIGRLARWTRRYPKAKLCVGNHDLIPRRQAATIGMGKRYLKSIGELLELPKAWEIEDKFVIDNVVYKHGTGYGGKYAYADAAIDEQKSCVIGHLHSLLGKKYIATEDNLIFGMAVGCGMDSKAYAAAYGKYSRYKPILGCGIVYHSMYASEIPMSMEYFRS